MAVSLEMEMVWCLDGFCEGAGLRNCAYMDMTNGLAFYAEAAAVYRAGKSGLLCTFSQCNLDVRPQSSPSFAVISQNAVDFIGALGHAVPHLSLNPSANVQPVTCGSFQIRRQRSPWISMLHRFPQRNLVEQLFYRMGSDRNRG